MSAFGDDWGFPGAVRDQLQFELELSPLFYDVKPTGKAFRTGRPKFEAVFTTARISGKVVAVRDAMELTSKVTGKPYFMVRKHGTSKPAKLSLGDVFADDKEFLSECSD